MNSCENCSKATLKYGGIYCKRLRNPEIHKKKLCEAHEEMDPRILAKRKSQLATLKRLQEQDEVL